MKRRSSKADPATGAGPVGQKRTGQVSGGPAPVSAADAAFPDRPPLISDLRVLDRIAFTTGQTGSGMPHLARLLVSTALRTRERAPVCIVLPSAEHCASVVAILAALECLAFDLPATTRAFIESGLVAGTQVRLLPAGPVYTAGERTTIQNIRGIYLEHTNARGKTSSAKSFVAEDRIAWFEPTLRKRPLADGTRPIITPPPNELDRILGRRSYANPSLFRTRVLLAGTRKGFERALQQASLGAEAEGPPAVIDFADAFAWGGPDETGVPMVFEPPGSLGNPLVCVGRDLQELAAAALDPTVEPDSRLVLTDRLDLVMKDLDLAGRIAERQRILLITDARRRLELAPLRRQRWAVWEPAPDEIVDTGRSEIVSTRCTGLDLSQRAAVAEMHMGPGYVECPSDGLAAIDQALAGLASFLQDEAAEHDERLQNLLDDAQQVFFSATGRLTVARQGNHDAAAALTSRLRESIGYVRRYLGEQPARMLAEYADRIDAFILDTQSDGVTLKGRELLRLAETATAQTGFRQLFVTGTRRGAEEANAFFASQGIDLCCAQISGLLDERNVRSVVAFNVMRRDVFERLTDPWPCSSLLFLGYDFELECYRRRLRRRSAERHAASLDDATRERLTGLPATAFLPRRQPPVVEQEVTAEELELDAFDRVARDWSWSRKIAIPEAAPGETQVEAHVVRFVGRSWAAMTPEHRSICLVRGVSGKTDVRHVPLADLIVGSHVIFREGAGRDVIQALAERRAGHEHYAELRRRAGLWREALRTANIDARTAMKRLQDHGIHRNIMTVRAWLNNPALLGPKTEEDLEAIREAFPLPQYSKADWARCRDALGELRSLHISAGALLTDLLAHKCGRMLFETSDSELAVDLGIGVVWIVEVAAIEAAPISCPSHAVNRLQWLDLEWKAAHASERFAEAGD